jgi:tryptophan synthase
MADRISNTFRRRLPNEHPTFVAYVTAGFPTLKDTVPVLLAMQESGVDIIEVRDLSFTPMYHFYY